MSEQVGTPLSEAGTLADWTIPGLEAAEGVQILALAGEVTTIVGANGAGKSALGYWFDQHAGTIGKRLIAHRRLWFPNAGPDMSPAQREQTGTHMNSWKADANSRFVDHADGQRPGIVLFDALAKINSQSQQMVAKYQEGASRDEVEAELGVPFLDRLNAILEQSGLPIKLALTETQTFDAMNRDTEAVYPINSMSDGEKSAVLLGAELIASPAGRVFIIDEPERHLHRSISARLIEAIVADRMDSHFVILTHDLDLAARLSSRPGQTYSLKTCRWDGANPVGWDLANANPDGTLPESAQLAILGGRRDVLFIEGDDHSLDRRLYELLFPRRTLFAAGGCEQVIRAVTGLRTSAAHHWVSAQGVVDGDGRDEAERQSLFTRGILALPVSEVENLYYLDEVIASVAAVQADTLGESALDMHTSAREAALEALIEETTLDRFASELAKAELQRKFVDNIPTTVDGQLDPIQISVPSPYPEIRKKLGDLAKARDYNGLIKLAPVRNTALRAQVSSTLGFRRIEAYEAAVRVRVQSDTTLAEQLRTLVGEIP